MAMPTAIQAKSFYRCAHRRREESLVLLKFEQPTGAVYLGGYVVECIIKALILEGQPAAKRDEMMDRLKRIGHNLSSLLVLYRIEGGSPPPAAVVNQYTYVINLWSTELRYSPKQVKGTDAEKFRKAVDDVYEWADRSL